jgi:hypothetical protein
VRDLKFQEHHMGHGTTPMFQEHLNDHESELFFRDGLGSKLD